jgi:hypothetical protein
MGNTPNNNFPYPESTDLVKDGATAIENLADAIDTTLGVYADPGLVLLNTTSFSGVASQSLAADTFTTTYDNYKLLIDITAVTADATIFLKMRKAGTDSSASYYSSNSWAFTTNTANPDARSNETTGMRLGFCDGLTAGHYYSFDVTLFRPKINDKTTATATTVNALTTGAQQGGAGGYWHDVTDTYDSATLIASSGNITGTIYCYGWNK